MINHLIDHINQDYSKSDIILYSNYKVWYSLIKVINKNKVVNTFKIHDMIYIRLRQIICLYF